MSFVKTAEEIRQKFKRETVDFLGAELLLVNWETKPEIIKRLLPPPLKPYKRPIASAYVANFPKTNFGVSYSEAAINLAAEFNGKLGFYCLSMPVTNDMAMALGREIFGLPKKMANIHLQREGKELKGWAERHGTRFFETRVKLTGKPNAADALKILAEMGMAAPRFVTVFYMYKHSLAPDLTLNFDYKPRLFGEDIGWNPKTVEFGEAEIILKSSDHDPWGEVEIQRVLGGAYLVGNNSMQKSETIAEVEPDKFKPYAYTKWDPL